MDVRDLPCVGRWIEGKAILPYLGAMSKLTITSKGQVTLRKEVLAHLGVKAGDEVEVEFLPDGRIEVHKARPKGDISRIFGALRNPDGPKLTIEEMNDIIADGWAGKR